jgi:hypothetical protein
MSQVTHPRAQIVDLRFRLRTWLALAAAIVAVGVPTAVIVANDDSSQSSNSQAATYTARPDEGQYVVDDGGAFKQSGQDTTGARP